MNTGYYKTTQDEKVKVTEVDEDNKIVKIDNLKGSTGWVGEKEYADWVEIDGHGNEIKKSFDWSSKEDLGEIYFDKDGDKVTDTDDEIAEEKIKKEVKPKKKNNDSANKK
jgi:hypothetical protein